jgi:hypothetical protein
MIRARRPIYDSRLAAPPPYADARISAIVMNSFTVSCATVSAVPAGTEASIVEWTTRRLRGFGFGMLAPCNTPCHAGVDSEYGAHA